MNFPGTDLSPICPFNSCACRGMMHHVPNKRAAVLGNVIVRAKENIRPRSFGGRAKKEPRLLRGGVQIGDDILSQDIILVPSALVSLTSLFGMGRGGPHRNSHLKSWIRFEIIAELDQNRRSTDATEKTFSGQSLRVISTTRLCHC